MTLETVSKGARDLAQRRRPALLKIAFVVTAAYASCFGVGVLWFAFVNEPGGFFDAPAKMSLETVANVFAGGSAPLAFLWLLIAVLMQSQELSLQGEELRLTRLEFQESRKVMTMQAEESRRQAEFIGTQTSILDAEHKLRIEDRADMQAEEVLKGIMRFALRRLERWKPHTTVSVLSHPEKRVRRTVFDDKAVDDVDHGFQLLVDEIDRQASLVAMPGPEARVREANEIYSRKALEILAKFVDVLVGLEPQLSQGRRIFFSTVGLNALPAQLASLIAGAGNPMTVKDAAGLGMN